MRNVRVRSRGPEHDSALSAIEFAQTFDRARGNEHESLILGRKISWVNWTEDSLAFGVEGGVVLSLRIQNGTVAHHVLAGGHERQELVRQPLILNFSPTVSATWDRSALADALVGQTLRKIFVTPDLSFLYVSRRSEEGIVAVSVLVDADTGSEFLYWDFSE